MLEWKPDYETGVPAIDTQHKVLFDTINRIEQLLGNVAVDRAGTDYLLEFLEEYAAQHFKDEETCMARYHCPAHAKNKEEHEQFLNVVRRCRSECMITNPTWEVLEKLHTTVAWWINNHILNVDIQLRGCLGSGTTAGPTSRAGRAAPPIT
jgi:hemerythrin